jgi:hypothetical protein
MEKLHEVLQVGPGARIVLRAGSPYAELFGAESA